MISKKEWVHQTQAKYEQCDDKETCPELWTTITTPTGRLMAVMEPYKTTQTEPEKQEEKPVSSPPTSNPTPKTEQTADELFEELFGYSPSTSNPTPTKNAEKLEIPNWIRNTAKWFGDGSIGESDFTTALQYMIKNEIIKIPNLPDQPTNPSETKVPDWIKNNAKWWGDGKISDDDFVNGIKYLVEKGIINVN